MSLEKNKIDSCKKIVLWLITDRSTKPSLKPLTQEDILTCFTIEEKKKRITKAIEQLISEEKVIKIKLLNDKNLYYTITPEVINKNVSI